MTTEKIKFGGVACKIRDLEECSSLNIWHSERYGPVLGKEVLESVP